MEAILTTIWLLAGVVPILVAIIAAAVSVRREEKRRDLEKVKKLQRDEQARHLEAKRRSEERREKETWLQGEKETWLREERIRREERKFTRRRDALPFSLLVRKAPDGRSDKHVLYGRQEGICAGCFVPFPFRNLTVDHILPRAHGGSDHINNLQLLCHSCNSTKGTLSQEAFIARLIKDGIRTA